MTTIINIIMTPILIHGYLGFPKLGVTGSGVATLVARALALAVGFFILYQGKMRVTVRLKDIRPCFKTLWQIIVVGVPSSLQMSTRMIMNLILMAIVAKFGTVAVAAYTVGMRIRMIGLFPSFGFGGAAATMVGQNLGADRRNAASGAAGWQRGWGFWLPV